MENNQEQICQQCGTTNYGVIHNCLKCGAAFPTAADDAETDGDTPFNRFEAPTVLDDPPDPPAYIEVLTGADMGNRYALTDGLTFGRSRSCDLVIDSPKASREHAQIIQNEYQQWLLVDLGSTNGTVHNQRRITQPSVLYNGDHFQIGDYDFKVTIKKPYHIPSPPDQPEVPPVGVESQPLQAPSRGSGCLNNRTLIILAALLILVCLCVFVYFGWNLLYDQGWV